VAAVTGREGSDAGANEAQKTVARLLEAVNGGDRGALDQLFAMLYDELREIAHRQRRRWRGEYTLNTTALVHEAYVKLVGQARVGVENGAHFRALAARAMRHILCDYARRSGARRRGGGLERLSLDELQAPTRTVVFTAQQSEILLALDDAMRRLERIDPRQSEVVECRFFGGLTIEETATAIGISPRTVKRDWALAQAWLHREMTSRP
jgi:RNA polymerase sigma factor (TIGR02999 family)